MSAHEYFPERATSEGGIELFSLQIANDLKPGFDDPEELSKEITEEPELARDGSMDPMDLYIKAISQYPLLNREQEIELALQIEQGGDEAQKAKDRLVTSNLRLNFKIAKEYRGRGLDLLDLIQEGSKGLIRSAELYDWRQSKFSVYAGKGIHLAIRRGIVNLGNSIRRTQAVAQNESYVKKARNNLMVRSPNNPSPEEIAYESGISLSEVQTVLQAPVVTDSIDRLMEDNHSVPTALIDELSLDPFEVIAEKDQKMAVLKIVADLPAEQREAITQLYGLNGGEPKTYVETAYQMRIDRKKVSLIGRQALARLCELAEKSGIQSLD